MIVTHGHEDHIGGIAYHLKQFDIPVIYGPRLAMAMLEGKLEEAGVRDRTELRSVRPRELVRLGSSFIVEFIRNTHSIADSFTIAIHTPLGVVIHTGDFDQLRSARIHAIRAIGVSQSRSRYRWGNCKSAGYNLCFFDTPDQHDFRAGTKA